jgi:uncharacterized protein
VTRTPAEILSEAHTIALVGASPKAWRPSHSVMHYLLEHGYRVIPVRPHVKEVLGVPCVPSLSEIEEPIDLVDVFRRAEFCPAVAEEAVAAGAKALWLQLGIVSPEARKIAERAGIDYVEDACTAIVHRAIIVRDMSCFNCGGDLPEGARFCPSCGAPVGETNALPLGSPTPNPGGWELCEIVCWRGYFKADFYARQVGSDDEIERSPMFRWRHDDPPPREGKFLAAHERLVSRLVNDGWQPLGEARPWYAQRFRRRIGGLYDVAAETPAGESQQAEA